MVGVANAMEEVTTARVQNNLETNIIQEADCAVHNVHTGSICQRPLLLPIEAPPPSAQIPIASAMPQSNVQRHHRPCVCRRYIGLISTRISVHRKADFS